MCIFLAEILELPCPGKGQFPCSRKYRWGRQLLWAWPGPVSSLLYLAALDLSFIACNRVVVVTVTRVPYISAAHWRLAVSVSLGSLLEMHISWLCPGLLNWNLWGWGPSNQFYQPSR